MYQLLTLLLSVVLLVPPPASAAIRIATRTSPTVDDITASGDEVVPLGSSRDPSTGKSVDGFAIVHHRDFDSHRSEKIEAVGDSEKCFKVIAKKARWKTVEPWVVNPSNTQGIAADQILAIVNDSVNTWEAAASGVDILGSGSLTGNSAEADTIAPDGNNEISFGTLSRRNVLAITFVWGYFRGSSKRREIIEWDQVYNQGDYAWTTSGESGKMDLGTVVLHELGHAVGLDDLYKSKCSAVAMFGHAEVGVTVKRSLGLGDRAGVQSLYNPAD